jgi:inorganic pyrophosphatase
LDEIVHFFTEYKKLEHKSVKVEGWASKQEALKTIEASHEDWKRRQNKQ